MSGPTAPKTKRGAARREALLRAAEAVIGEQGFAASSIADITRRAETALGTFYIYFSSKEEVFRELVLEMGRLTRAGGPLLGLSALVGALLVVLADFTGQILLPARYPVGIVTGVLGAPYLLYLIVLMHRKGAA